ncbi:hypothetical protein ACROYT_G003278 [Oculina patagonica]
MFPSTGKSHFLVFTRLADELAQRGHKVQIVVGDFESYVTSQPNVRIYKTPQPLYQIMLTRRGPKKGLDVVTEMSSMSKLMALYCEGVLNDKELINDIRNADLIIGDGLYMCSSLIASKFSLPHIVVLLNTLNLPAMRAFGVPLMPSFVPQFKSTLADEMSFVERLQNIYHWILVYCAFNYGMVPPFHDLKEKYNIAPDETIYETVGRVDLIISQKPFILEYPRPVLPNTKVVGPLLTAPAKPLPDEFEEFMQESGDEGVILVSFGTIMGNINEKMLALLADAFSRVSQRIIWKLNIEETKVKLSNNIKVASWLPQNDILGHNKTKLFINHGGGHGLMEAAYHGVPMICAPFFGDQYDNAYLAKRKGFAEVVNLNAITADELVDVIGRVISNQSYRESAVRLSKFITLLPRSPVQEAADWIEYTHAVGGLQHLRPRCLDLPFCKLYFLDILLVMFLAFAFLWFSLRCLRSRWFDMRNNGLADKEKKEKRL